MKKFLTFLFSLSFYFFLCQKVELKKVTDSSQIFKGEIAGVPVTMQLYFAGIADCGLYQYFVDGWYYYDKYQKKIPLTGIYDYGKLSLYNFGTQQKQHSKSFRDSITSPQKVEKTTEIAEALHPKESIIFEQNDKSLFKNVNKKRVRAVNWIKNVNLELQNKKIDVSNGLNPYSVAIYKKNA